jgi:hypothetical protein
VTAKIHPAISRAPVILLPVFGFPREVYYYPVYLKLVREDHLLPRPVLPERKPLETGSTGA